MNIDWKPEETKFIEMEKLFLELGKRAISMNHYDFAEMTRGKGFTDKDWREFLSDPRVVEYINKEFEAIKSAELRKIVTDINSSKSVGQAQIINSLAKMLESKDTANEGPVFIYSYVPLSEEQKHADNVEVLDHDPFLNS